MDNSGIQMHPDKSHVLIDGRLYNCVDGGSDGLFRSADNGETVLIGEYVVDDISGFQRIIKSIVVNFKQGKDIQDIDKLSDEDLRELEDGIVESFHVDDRLKGVVYPYYHEIQDCCDGKKIIYTLSKVSDDFRIKYNKFRSVVFERNFAINLRLVAMSNLLDVIQALNVKFNGLFHAIDLNSIYIDIEKGDVIILFEKMLSKTDTEKNSGLNSDIAYIFFELLCAANPYDGKKTLIETPLLTEKKEDFIRNNVREFVITQKDNRLLNYTGKEILERWYALPELMRNALEDNLDDSRESITYDIDDWIRSARIIRDWLVLVNGSFKFCNPSDSNHVLFFSIEPYLIPVWPKKAVYGYHVEEENYLSSKKVLLGVNKDKNIVNYAVDELIIEYGDGREEKILVGEAFKPKQGMQMKINNKCISIIKNKENTERM